MKYFLIIGLSQGIFLSIALIYKSFVKQNNAWLIGIFVLLLSGIISGTLLNDLLGEPLGSMIVDPLILLIGPSFFLYILSFSKKLTTRDLLLHALAFLLYLPILAIFYSQHFSADLPRPSLQAVYSSTFAIVIGLLKFVHLFIYVWFSFSALRNHQIKIKRIFADLSGKDLAWLKYMLGAFVFLVFASLLIYIIALQLPDYQNQLTLVNLTLLSIFILTISFYAFHQNTLFDYQTSHLNAEEVTAVVSEDAGPRYEKSGLKPSEIGAIQEKIEAFVQAKGYLNPEVTLGSMSEAIGVPPHKISEVLGKHLNTSFYDLINQHRVEDIKKAIHDPALAHLTILSIAYDYGYNSKSTFNAAFKKFTGTTPSAFKNISHLESSS